MKNTDHLGAVQCSVGKLWILTFSYFDMYHITKKYCRPSTPFRLIVYSLAILYTAFITLVITCSCLF